LYMFSDKYKMCNCKMDIKWLIVRWMIVAMERRPHQI